MLESKSTWMINCIRIRLHRRIKRGRGSCWSTRLISKRRSARILTRRLKLMTESTKPSDSRPSWNFCSSKVPKALGAFGWVHSRSLACCDHSLELKHCHLHQDKFNQMKIIKMKVKMSGVSSEGWWGSGGEAISLVITTKGKKTSFKSWTSHPTKNEVKKIWKSSSPCWVSSDSSRRPDPWTLMNGLKYARI